MYMYMCMYDRGSALCLYSFLPSAFLTREKIKKITPKKIIKLSLRSCAEISNPPHVRFHKKTRRRSGLRGTLIFCHVKCRRRWAPLSPFLFLLYIHLNSSLSSLSPPPVNLLPNQVMVIDSRSQSSLCLARPSFTLNEVVSMKGGGKVGIYFFHHVWGLKETSPSPLRIDVVQQLFPLLPNQSKPTV